MCLKLENDVHVIIDVKNKIAHVVKNKFLKTLVYIFCGFFPFSIVLITSKWIKLKNGNPYIEKSFIKSFNWNIKAALPPEYNSQYHLLFYRVTPHSPCHVQCHSSKIFII